MSFTLLPAVDVVNGQAVRLDQGEAGTEKSYGSPLEAAERWRDEGAQWLHFVDLDAAGCARFVVTDVSRDGTLTGPNVDLLRDVSAATDAFVTASGGVSSISDVLEIAQFAQEGIDSVIIGKALYEHKFTLREALDALGRSEN